jgi:hypothetical protein
MKFEGIFAIGTVCEPTLLYGAPFIGGGGHLIGAFLHYLRRRGARCAGDVDRPHRGDPRRNSGASSRQIE